MSDITKESVIKFRDKNIEVDKALADLVYLSAEKTLEFFNSIKMMVPRSIRIDALRDSLRERATEVRKAGISLGDEVSYRLSYFDYFCEFQLENLIVSFDNRKVDRSFLSNFWFSLLDYFIDKKVPDNDLLRLFEEAEHYAEKSGKKLPDLHAYNKELWSIFFDNQNEIDGLTIKEIRPVLYKSSTLTEVRELGIKYGVNVPKRLKKGQVIDIIVTSLEDSDKDTEGVREKLNSLSIIFVERYAKDNDIKVSTELKKEEIIEYILSNSKETQEVYFVPSSQADYEMENPYAEEIRSALEEVALARKLAETESKNAALAKEALHLAEEGRQRAVEDAQEARKIASETSAKTLIEMIDNPETLRELQILRERNSSLEKEVMNLCSISEHNKSTNSALSEEQTNEILRRLNAINNRDLDIIEMLRTSPSNTNLTNVDADVREEILLLREKNSVLEREVYNNNKIIAETVIIDNTQDLEKISVQKDEIDKLNLENEELKTHIFALESPERKVVDSEEFEKVAKNRTELEEQVIDLTSRNEVLEAELRSGNFSDDVVIKSDVVKQRPTEVNFLISVILKPLLRIIIYTIIILLFTIIFYSLITKNINSVGITQFNSYVNNVTKFSFFGNNRGLIDFMYEVIFGWFKF